MTPKAIIDEKLISKHFALPLYKRGNRLYIAVADPTNLAGLDEINFNTGLSTDAVLVEADKLAKAIESYLSDGGDIGGGLEGIDDEELDSLNVGASETESDDDNEPGGDEAPVVRFVNKVLLDAIRTGASDIHFEPYEKSYRVRLRTDGILREIARPPIQLATRLSARLKVMSKMDISERRVPQDGRFKMKLSKTKAIDFRVNSYRRYGGRRLFCGFSTPLLQN